MKLGAFNRINTAVSIFLLKSVHGHTDRSEQTVKDETVKVRVIDPRPSASEVQGRRINIIISLRGNS